MTRPIKLNPCPFCEGEPQFVALIDARYRVQCTECDERTTHHDNRRDAAAEWNAFIDFNKRYETREGRPVILFPDFIAGDFPVLGAWKDDSGRWIAQLWRADGRLFPPGDVDALEDLVPLADGKHPLQPLYDQTQELEAMTKIRLDKKYRMRNGWSVRIFMTDAGGPYSVLGAYKGENGTWYPQTWTEDGRALASGYGSNPHDLVEATPRPAPQDFPCQLVSTDVLQVGPSDIIETSYWVKLLIEDREDGRKLNVRLNADQADDLAEYLHTFAQYLRENAGENDGD